MPDRPERPTVDGLLADALAVLARPGLADGRKLALVAAQVRLALRLRKLARARRAAERPILDWVREGEADRA